MNGIQNLHKDMRYCYIYGNWEAIDYGEAPQIVIS